MAKAMGVMMDTEHVAGDKASTVAEVWVKVEAVVTREALVEALAAIDAFLPPRRGAEDRG